MAERRPTNLTSSSRSPGHRVPWWVLIWIKRSPLVFLVMSVACFSAGLMLFTYSSGQVRRPAPLSSCVPLVFSSGTRDLDDNHRSNGESTSLAIPYSSFLLLLTGCYIVRSRCCICLVCIRTMDIQPTQRTKVARRGDFGSD